MSEAFGASLCLTLCGITARPGPSRFPGKIISDKNMVLKLKYGLKPLLAFD